MRIVISFKQEAMKYSRQRELILKTLKENPVHPTADFIYELLRKELSSISLATVYRNLNQLAENGIIKKVPGLDGSIHFDHSIHPHYHFICTKCNKVYDVPYDVAPNPAEKLYERTGLTAESCDLSFKGICKDCRKDFN